MRDWKKFLVLAAIFLLAYFLPFDNPKLGNAILEGFRLLQWYAIHHTLACVVPAMFIAGAISTFLSQASVMRYLGPRSNRIGAYAVASVAGIILAVCSCSVLPMFAGIYTMGAGLGPASAFLYSGPAVNVLAVVLTARILGPEIGLARALGAVAFSIVIGLCMHLLFRKEEQGRAEAAMHLPQPEEERPLWQNAVYFTVMVGILVSATWGEPAELVGFWHTIYNAKWLLTGFLAIVLGILLVKWFGVKAYKVLLAIVAVLILALLFPTKPLIAFSTGIIALAILTTTTRGATESWFLSTWDFAKQIMPLLFVGVLIAGLLLGRPGSEGIIPSQWVDTLVGGNSLWSNLFASVVGAFMYFATLTEVPILQGLLGAGMGKGPALALLLAGPALSLPNMLVIRSVMGTKKTIAFVCLVVVMATISGMIFGHFFS